MDSRTRLLTVAREILDSTGSGGVTIREVARRAGVSHGAPRRYFPTRTDLLAALARTGFAVLTDRLAAATAHRSPTDRLARAAGTYVRFAHDHRGLFELMFRHDLLVDSGHQLREVSLPLLTQWRGWYCAAFPDAPAERATLMWVAVHGLAVLDSSSALVLTGADPEALLALMLETG